MQAVITKNEQLNHEVTVTLPSEQLEAAVQKRLNEMSRTVKIAGFRPGKVPAKIMEERYGSVARYEAVQKLIEASLPNALQEVKLLPAGMPNIISVSSEVGAPLEYKMTFEVYPKIELVDLTGVTIEKPTSTVTEADIDSTLERMREQRANWVTVDRAAKVGDQVTVQVVATIKGKKCEPLSGDFSVKVQEDTKWPIQAEDSLLGAKVGDHRTGIHEIPMSASDKALAGKSAECDVIITAVQEPELPKLDDSFAVLFGVEPGTMTALKEEVRKTLTRELLFKCSERLRRAVFDALLEKNEVQVPAALTHERALDLLRSYDKQPEKLPPQMFEIVKPAAERQAKLGLLFNAASEVLAVTLDSARVDARIDEIAGAYADPAAYKASCYSSPKELQQIRSWVLEEQVVDGLLAKATLVEKPMSYEELMSKDALDENADEDDFDAEEENA